MAVSTIKQMIADGKRKLGAKGAGAPPAPPAAPGGKTDSSPSATRGKFLFSFDFSIYDAERMRGIETVSVEADTEDDAFTQAVEHVPTKDNEAFWYTGNWTKKSIA